MAGAVVGGGEAGRSRGLSEAVCVLPHAHDGQLPVPKLHLRARRRALRLPARLPAEQPHHGAPC